MTAENRQELPRFAELEAEYEILEELGRGGTAVVYLARERDVGREVAIKVVRATYVEDEEAAARLVREARTIAGLRHPNIVMLYGTRRLGDGSLALIMQYIRGRTLKQEVRQRGPLPFAEVERILADIGGALAYAQRHRILHRDIKPENVYLDDETDRACLSDFGIARAWDDCSLTLPGTAIGTPAYMSPEQVDGAELDARSDIYSLGLVAWELLTGQTPWAGESLFRMIYKQKNEELPALAELRPDTPPRLRLVVDRALRKDPAARWSNADEFLSALTGTPAHRLTAPAERPAASMDQRGGLGAKPPARSSAGAARSDRADESLTVRYRRPDQVAADAANPESRPRVPAGAASGVAARAVRPDGVAAVSGSAAAPRVASGISGTAATGGTVAAGEPAATPAPGPARERRAAVATSTASRSMPVDVAVPAERLRRGDRRANIMLALVVLTVLIGTSVLLTAVRTAEPGAAAQTAGASPAPAALDEATAPVPEPTAADVEDRGVPAVAFAIYGDMQDGVVADTLATPLVVRVEDAAGDPVPGATVLFATTAGVMAPDTAITDEHGLATARWVPDEAGVHEAVAVVMGIDREPVTFRARVGPRPAVRLTAGSTTTGGASGPGESSVITVRAVDDRGAPVAGAEVRFAVRSGGGRIARSAAVTGRDGVARVEWTLGLEGAQEATAALPSGVQEPLVFQASLPAESPRLVVRSGVTTGGTHTCSLEASGAVLCWGGNDSGQLGDGSAGRRTAPARVALPEPIARLSAGVSHTCGVSVLGNTFCWGANSTGQLGDGTAVGRAEPVPVGTDRPFTDVFAGSTHTCGLDAAGRLYCWGQNSHGQLGDGSRTNRTAPVRAGGNRTFVAATVGWAHTCGLAGDGTAFCWGRNSSGELGDGRTADRAAPAAVAGGHRFTAIAAGSAHTCGLSTGGTILCWGQNDHGQLGNGSAGNSPAPVAVAAEGTFARVTVGGVHSCGLTREGAAYCWGRNSYGQLGDGTTQDRPRPVAVEGGHRFTSLQASGAHTCGTAAGTGRVCWGFNLAGQLGDGTRVNQTRPVVAGRQ